MMKQQDVFSDLSAELDALPVIDAHTHLIGDHLGAKGLHDILLYHMAVSDLYGAGCPSGARLTQYPGFPDKEEAHQRLQEALPFLPLVRSTSISWCIRMILKDLYGWDQTITLDNWNHLDHLIRERSEDAGWHRAILQRAKVEQCGTEIARRGNGQADDFLFYALEWGFFTRCQWEEFDTALYELERCWGCTPDSPAPIGAGKRPATARVIESIEDVHAAVQWYVSQIPVERVVSIATHLSTDIKYQVVKADEMVSALARRSTAGAKERDIYASYINEVFLTELERQYGERVLFQFSFGAEPLPYETGSILHTQSISQLAEMIGRHPGLRFQCYLSNASANQALCSLCRELPNLSLAGYWWHNFFPGLIERVFTERLDMLPLNRQAGFFSDAYCVEWVYGKLSLVKKMMAKVLAERVTLGQFSMDDAVAIAGQLLKDSTLSLIQSRPMKVASDHP